MPSATIEEITLQYAIEKFLFTEAELIDSRRYDEWLDLFSEDLIYFMPIRRNVKFGDHAEHENTKQGVGISWFDEDKWTLAKRVEQINTGYHYAEEPLSRVCHLVSNIVLSDVRPNLQAPLEIDVHSRFVVHQNRVETETYTFIGKRYDTLRANGQSWLISRREIMLNQSVLMAKNLSTFF